MAGHAPGPPPLQPSRSRRFPADVIAIATRLPGAVAGGPPRRQDGTVLLHLASNLDHGWRVGDRPGLPDLAALCGRGWASGRPASISDSPPTTATEPPLLPAAAPRCERDLSCRPMWPGVAGFLANGPNRTVQQAQCGPMPTADGSRPSSPRPTGRDLVCCLHVGHLAPARRSGSRSRQRYDIALSDRWTRRERPPSRRYGTDPSRLARLSPACRAG